MYPKGYYYAPVHGQPMYLRFAATGPFYHENFTWEALVNQTRTFMRRYRVWFA